MTQFYADGTVDVVVEIPTFMGTVTSMHESDVLTMLSEIASDNPSGYNAYYIAGTLCIDTDDDVLLFDVDKCLTFAIQAEVAQSYIKHKSKDHAYWTLAQEIVAKCNEIVEVCP